MPAKTALSDEAVGAPNRTTSQRLFSLGCTALFIAIAILANQSKLTDPILLALGVGTFVLGAVPALNWARRCDPHFPAFEMFMLTTIPFYAVPLLSGRQSLLTFSTEATLAAAAALLAFQACAVTTFLATKGDVARSPALTTTLLPQAAIKYAQTGLWLSSLYFYAHAFTDWIPWQFANTIRAAFFGVGTVSLFIMSRRWGLGQLRAGEKLVVVVNLTLQLVFTFRGLYLITGISVLLLGLIGYISTSRRVPILVLGIFLPILAVLHNGKPAMRKIYWGDSAPAPSIATLPDFFQSWVQFGLNPPEDDSEVDVGVTGRLFDRASLFQMLCLVTDRTPEFEPFLAGESYVHLPAQLIPSFLWPGKPSSLLSNILLAVHYGLVSADSTTSVSIAFGMIAEAYANFSIAGCAALGVLLGYGYKRISLAAIGCPQFSALGLLTILLAAWSFQAEQIFATWVVSLIQAGGVVIGVPLAIRLLFRQE